MKLICNKEIQAFVTKGCSKKVKIVLTQNSQFEIGEV